MVTQSHQPDWVPGGRYGTKDKYTKGFDNIFGERDMFKNLEESENYVGVATDRFPGIRDEKEEGENGQGGICESGEGTQRE